MEIIIQSLGFKAGDTLESFVKEKLNVLKGDKIIGAEVILYMGPDSNPENNYCEIRLQVPGNDLFVKKHGQYFENAVSECVEVLSHSLKKAKEKQLDRRQAEAVTVQDAIIENDDESTSEPELEDVVR